MLSYANSYKVDLTASKLPLKDLVLARVSISEDDYGNFETNLTSLIPTATIINVKKTVMTPEGQVAREFQWLDIEIYIPKTEENRWFNGMGNVPELISQAVAGVHPLIALVEVINLNEEITPIYYRREFGDLSLLPTPEGYEFVFRGIATRNRIDSEGVLLYRGYTGENWFVNGIFDQKLSTVDAQYRPSKSILFALALHYKGLWVFGTSIKEAVDLANSTLVPSNPSPTLNTIVENLWKLNPELQEEPDYQVYHRALHAYKIAYGTLTPDVIASILTNPNHYKGLAEYLITAPNPPEPNLRTYIAQHVTLEQGRYGVTSKELTQQAPGGL